MPVAAVFASYLVPEVAMGESTTKFVVARKKEIRRTDNAHKINAHADT